MNKKINKSNFQKYEIKYYIIKIMYGWQRFLTLFKSLKFVFITRRKYLNLSLF